MRRGRPTIASLIAAGLVAAVLTGMPAYAIGVSAGTKAAIASPFMDLARYEVIIAKKPFGEPDLPVMTNQPPPPPPPSFFKNLKMVGVTETEDSASVGFVDVVARPPKNYLLRIGETEDGITVVDADYTAASALLRKDGEEQWIYMYGEAVGAHTSAAGGPSSSVSTPSTPGIGPMTSAGSYMDRLKKRREAQRRQQEAEKSKLTREEMENRLKEYRQELIKSAKIGSSRQTTAEPSPVTVTEEQTGTEGVEQQGDGGDAPAEE